MTHKFSLVMVGYDLLFEYCAYHVIYLTRNPCAKYIIPKNDYRTNFLLRYIFMKGIIIGTRGEKF